MRHKLFLYSRKCKFNKLQVKYLELVILQDVKSNSYLLGLSIGSAEDGLGQKIRLEDRSERYYINRMILASTEDCCT